MTSSEAFHQAREQLIRAHGDPDRACSSFRWPRLDAFNWATHWFDELAESNHRPALRVVTDDGTESVSFAELLDRSRRVARYLRDTGVNRGDRILVMLTNVVALWESMLAAIRLGAVVIPATTQLTGTDVDARIERGGARHIITDPQGAAKLARPERLQVKLAVGGAPGFTPFDTARASAARIDNAETHADDPLLLYFTSGTTAKPKMVMHTHASYPVGHLSTMYWIGIEERDVHWNISSPGWAKHAWSSFFAPWNAAATIFVFNYARFDSGRILDALRRFNVSTLCAPPTVWRMLILENLGARPAALREIVSAGEPRNPEIIDRVERAWKITIRDGYGQTETSAQFGNSPGQTVRAGSMGRPLPGYRVALLDAEGHLGDDGEIVLDLDPPPVGLMPGYLEGSMPVAQAGGRRFYRTFDVAARDKDGYYWYVGRADD